MEDNSWKSDLEEPSCSTHGSKKAKMNDGSSRLTLENSDILSAEDTAASTTTTKSPEVIENDAVNIVENETESVTHHGHKAKSSGDDVVDLEEVDETVAENIAENFVELQAHASTEPANEVVIVAPSNSAAQAILLACTRENLMHGLNQRQPLNIDESDDASSINSDNDTPRDSDDLSSEETPSTSRRPEDVGIDENNLQDESSISSVEEDDEPLPDFESDEESDEDTSWIRSRNLRDDRVNRDPPAVLSKQRPKSAYVLTRELFNRELGLSLSQGKRHETVNFPKRYNASLHAVYKLEKLCSLVKHKRCVNSLNFNPDGRLLVTGSDDTSIVVWNWAKNEPLHVIKNVHKTNIFQSKFLYLNSEDHLNIVTSARDGYVKLLQCDSSGTSWSRRRLAGHTRAVNSLHVMRAEPTSIFSAGEDGMVLHCDLRTDKVNRLIELKQRGGPLLLHCINGNPINPLELVIAGRDKFARVYDRRIAKKPLALYCPTALTELPSIANRTMRLTTVHMTSAVFNHDGSEILGSYSNDDIYLFDIKADVYKKNNRIQVKKGYSLRFSGHRNNSSLKSVTFYGPGSEYVISGSDCGNIYIWHKESESIVGWLKADANGVVNTIEVHPWLPFLASSGLDKDVKIWAPLRKAEPNFDGLESTVYNNCATQWRNPLFNEFLPSLFRTWRADSRLVRDEMDEEVPFAGPNGLEGNICSTI